MGVVTVEMCFFGEEERRIPRGCDEEIHFSRYRPTPGTPAQPQGGEDQQKAKDRVRTPGW